MQVVRQLFHWTTIAEWTPYVFLGKTLTGGEIKLSLLVSLGNIPLLGEFSSIQPSEDTSLRVYHLKNFICRGELFNRIQCKAV